MHVLRKSTAALAGLLAAIRILAYSVSSARAFHVVSPVSSTIRPRPLRPPSGVVMSRCHVNRKIVVAGAHRSGGSTSARLLCRSPLLCRSTEPRSSLSFVGGWASRTPRAHRRGRSTDRSGAPPGASGRLCMRIEGGGGKGESVRNRALATVVYLLPMLDGIDCGQNVFRVLPEVGGVVHTLLAPALAVWEHVPFMPLVMFIILQVSVRRQDTSRFVRFNVQQAILVDILTVVLGLLGTAVGTWVPEGEQFMTNFAFYCLAGAVAYAVSETVRGRVANQIPLISAAAEIQIGP